MTCVTHIMIDVAEHPTHDYPFAVYAEGPIFQWPSHKSQGISCRSLRDCLLVANGMAHAFMAANVPLTYHNPKWGERVTKPE